MAGKIRAKLVLELTERGMSVREIRATRHIAPASVKKVRDAAAEKGVTWADVEGMADSEVYDLLFPAQAEAEAALLAPDYDYVHDELQRDGVTLKLLWEELRDRAAREGLAAKGHDTFCRGYADYVSARRVTSHLEHRPGQAMEVDWSGTTMRLVDPATGEVSRAHLFVAVLPHSQRTFVPATADMRRNAWLRCHVEAYAFFGGVAVRCVCDNLKTGVVSHPREGEVVLNEAYEALGRHCCCAIMPTGVRRPRQKASVEGAVGKVATAVVARLRDEVFYSLADLNAAIRERLAEFNSAPFQKRDGSRAEVFELVERTALAPLPAEPFEPCEWVYGRTVGLNFHARCMRNSYSVPHGLVGRKVDLKVTDSLVEAYRGGERAARRPRFPSCAAWQYSTDPSHMPPGFCRPEWDDARIRRRASSIGPDTRAVVDRIFDGVQVKEQAYSPALAVPSLSRRYGEPELEAACGYALARTQRPRCRFIRSVLASGVAAPAAGGEAPGGYLRGASYYGGEGQGR